MLKAILLDLDDTLIDTDTPRFVARYTQALARWLTDCLPVPLPMDPIALIQQGVAAAVQDLDPTRTLQEKMEARLAAAIGRPLSEIQAVLAAFHATDRPDLVAGIAPRIGAAGALRRFLAEGYAVVIATNPLFPAAAIWARMAAGGLPLDLPYALITHSENTHYAKPTPHYYEEILARVGAEADEALMVGDSQENDMVPAGEAGLKTYPTPDAAAWAGFLARIDGGLLAEIATQTAAPDRPDQVAPRLMGNTAALFGMVTSAPPAYWNQRPTPGEWTPIQTVCHLRDSERNVQRPRLERIAREENPFLSPSPPPDPGDCSAADPQAIAAEFWAERQITLRFLAALPAEAWSRPARHAIFGPTSLVEMAHFTARHDHLHLNQLCQTLGKCRDS